MQEKVVLVDNDNNEIGAALKSKVHSQSTPLHRGFSLFLFNTKGELLIQKRANTKQTWPGVWSNSCCGHPMPKEGIEIAIIRRAKEELGIQKIEDLHAIIIGGGVYYWQQSAANTDKDVLQTQVNSLKQQVSQLRNNNTSPTPTAKTTVTPATNATTSVTSNWKTYTNSKYGFSFKYPNDWSYDTLQNGNEISFTPNGKKFYVEGSEMGVIRVVTYPDVTFNSNNYSNATEVIIDSKTGYKTTGNSGEASTVFNINNNPVHFVNDVGPAVSTSEYKDLANEYNSVYDQLVSTIDFTK